MVVLRNILVAADFEETSGAALDYGRNLAHSYGSTLHILHAVENVLVRFAGEGALALLPDLQAAVESDARKRMEALVTAWDRTTLRAKAVIVTAPEPAEAIVEYAKEHDIDLIVMGTHGRRGFTHMVMGSVAERVVRTAPCPVLTMRRPERELIGPDALLAVASA